MAGVGLGEIRRQADRGHDGLTQFVGPVDRKLQRVVPLRPLGRLHPVQDISALADGLAIEWGDSFILNHRSSGLPWHPVEVAGPEMDQTPRLYTCPGPGFTSLLGDGFLGPCSRIGHWSSQAASGHGPTKRIVHATAGQGPTRLIGMTFAVEAGLLRMGAPVAGQPPFRRASPMQRSAPEASPERRFDRESGAAGAHPGMAEAIAPEPMHEPAQGLG